MCVGHRSPDPARGVRHVRNKKLLASPTISDNIISDGNYKSNTDRLALLGY